MILTYYSNVTKGKLEPETSRKIAHELNSFEGKRVEIKIQKLRSKRSEQQNSYWWVLVTLLANELGYEKDEMHEVLKFKFLKREKVIEQTGEIMYYSISTTKLSVTEFIELIDKLIRWAAIELSIVLPLPSEFKNLMDGSKEGG